MNLLYICNAFKSTLYLQLYFFYKSILTLLSICKQFMRKFYIHRESSLAIIQQSSMLSQAAFHNLTNIKASNREFNYIIYNCSFSHIIYNCSFHIILKKT